MPARFLLAVLVIAPSFASAAPRFGVASPLVKIRPSTPAPAASTAQLEAARNEFEPFQIVLEGGSAGLSNVSAAAVDLQGPGGARIAARHLVLYRVGLYEVRVASNSEGATGRWPDPLIPDVDTYVGEKRNAFPFAVPAGESRAIWADLFVPPGTPSGDYTGKVTVQGDGFDLDVPVQLHVFPFDLPSRSTLKTAFGMGWSDACTAHFGSADGCGGEAAANALRVLYGRAGLDHRISISDVVDQAPPWPEFDQVFGPLLEGTAPTRLPGAALTTLSLKAATSTGAIDWRDHFGAKGWLDVLFDYACDEPPAGCSFSSIPDRSAAAHAAGLPALVTTSIAKVQSQGVQGSIDILTPVINHMQDKDGPDHRPEYDAFLAGGKELWWYQSCMSHGCASGCEGTSDPYFTGWPSYMIDASGIQNRAMEWLSYSYRISGELYFGVAVRLSSAWDDSCSFGGNGDGTLFYPGTPQRIGGKTHIPVDSVRLKLIREGMEDYEYLHLLDTLGGRDVAMNEARALFPDTHSVTSATPEQLMAARDRLGRRIEALVAPAGAGSNDPGPAVGSDPGPRGTQVETTPATVARSGCAAGGGAASWLALAVGAMLLQVILRSRARRVARR